MLPLQYPENAKLFSFLVYQRGRVVSCLPNEHAQLASSDVCEGNIIISNLQNSFICVHIMEKILELCLIICKIFSVLCPI